MRGDITAKVEWAVVTGRNTFKLSAYRLNVNLSNTASVFSESTLSAITPYSHMGRNRAEDELTLLHTSYKPLKDQDRLPAPGGEPTKRPGSELSLNVESLLQLVDVNSIPLILAIGSRSKRLRPNVLFSSS